MSMNQFMHPRNIYKHPPNFKQLALDFPEFRKYVTIELSGKVTVDFKNVEVLRALNCTLLKKDFNLTIDIPLNKLIPTVPLRLNYILWLEDLLSLINSKEGTVGIDIGTGASCVYPLIAARKNNWSMVASEVDEDSIKYAIKNVTVNKLDDLIKIVKIEGDSLLEELIEKFPNNYDFCMCNPPFFASSKELNCFFKARKQTRPYPKNAFCASVNEVVSDGGETEFITKLINESTVVRSRIKIFTTMVGHKSTLPTLKNLLRKINVSSFKQTEFCQGNTTRWGLAWTFQKIDLRQIPHNDELNNKNKKRKPLCHTVTDGALDEVFKKLLEIFKQLQINHQEVKHNNNFIEFYITAYSDSWSHQRRKRRKQRRISGNLNSSGDSDETKIQSGDEINNACHKLADMDVAESTASKKRINENENENGDLETKKLKTVVDEYDSEKIYLKAAVSLIKDECGVSMEFDFIDGSGQREALHQILQYIKNNWKLTEDKVEK